MYDFFAKLFSSDFMGHGYCYLWNPEIVWLHAISDSVITLSYYAIPLALLYFVRRQCDLPFHWIFLLFAVFIFGCGTTHLMEVWTLWHGTYRLAGIIKAITAAASIATAGLLMPLIPKALALPSPAQLSAANLQLEQEVRERRRVEQALHKAYDEVERMVEQRTADLATINEQLQAEILERRHAEERRRRSEAFLAEGQRLSHTGSWAWNPVRGDILFSQETFRILEFDQSKPAVFQDVIERIHPNDRDYACSILEVAARERKNYEFEARIALPDASIRYIHLVGRFSASESGEPEFVGAMMDITERKRAEASLQAAQAELAHISRVTTMGEMAASIAHEINQPLAAVITNGNACLHWLARAEPDLNEGREAVTRMVKEANRASEVIRRMRALMKKNQPQVAPLDVNEVINDVLTLTRHQILRNGVSLKTELGSGVTPIQGDSIQLQQVMLNLVVNSIEATTVKPAGTRELLIRSQTQEPDGIVVWVCDSGVGLDPEKAEQIFEPFFTSKPHGMGMGLAISRSIIEAHGGRLWALPNQGGGATFQFSIPAAATA